MSITKVTFNNPETQFSTISKARSCDNVEGMGGIFMRPDRTTAEQDQFRTLNNTRKKANDELGDKLDKPFRFVIRGDRIRKINAIESSKEKRSVYV